ncbi:uncharacterized protein Bfra_005024 [Botrytis fragariae]|uniref:DUF676 domain-containing protein n=1 Tax=Botrytis fragariae TaxID=1964551 RepID=A0A8H6AU07_9HELO|nr:uncharacterized protein Bfra_005024 [Botrytis fragariae]KAF5873561.1 hypothetical protein Bfra_005024 [Botrytis fragariae]
MPQQISYRPVSDSPDATYHLIFFITGNPGLIGYYSTFLSLLNDLLSSSPTKNSDTYHIFGQSLAGFETDDVPSESPNQNPYSLEQQINLVHDCLLEQISGSSTPYKNVILIGHSVGSYILLEILSKLIAPAEIPSISAGLSGILLFPTVTHISHSPSGAKLTPLMSIPNFPVLASSTAKMLLYCAPNVILDFLVKKITGMPEEAAKVTTSFLRSKNGIWQALYVHLPLDHDNTDEVFRHLARDEMNIITDDKWDSEIWGVEHSESSQSSPPNLIFYFGENDHWVASHTRDALIAARASPVSVSASSASSFSIKENNKPIMMIDGEGIDHGFCISAADGTAALNVDFYDDSTPKELIDSKDFVSLYLRCRYDRRGDVEIGRLHEFEAGLPEGFIEELPENYGHKIKRELDRIAELRAIFVAKKRNLPDIVELKKRKVAWKENAIDSLDANLNSSQTSIHELKKEQAKLQQEYEAFKNQPTEATRVAKDLETNVEELRRAENKNRILKEVAKWKSPGDLIAEVEVEQDVPDDSGYGFSVSKITLEKRQSERTPKITSFDQYRMEKYSVSEVLESNGVRDPWARENTESIRYFHFPANNMKWIEQFKDIIMKAKTTDHRHREFFPGNCGQGSSMALQMIHFMLGTCVRTANVFLKMPYLHWEMDRKRAHMANIAKKLTSEHREKQTRYHIRHQNMLANLVKDNTKKFGFLHTAEAKVLTNSDGPAPSDKNTSGKVTKPWGRYLMQVAKVYEAMDLEPDIKLVHSHLHEQPPFHPRRTLDQSYYFKLENTESRDRDQVVYRGTKERRIIHASTRVVMVDQLWMYILDEHTIITSFPKRLGRNKPDSSGVHRCVRDRLEKIRPGQINSVYDLALLIMNECSMVFFDRTKPTDERPEVLDIFADAIGYVSEMKTTAFKLFWRHLEQLSGQRLKIDPEKARLYLNINPEGVLLREAHDIIEELRMMSRINLQQLQVTQVFSKALETFNGQVEPMQEMTGLLRLMLKELKKNSSDSNGMISNGTPSAEDSSAKVNKVMIKHTIDRSLDLVDTISNHHSELNQLEDSAREIAEQLRDLLTLKQQQASIIEATASLDRADESVHQGRSIMIFTVITIIFLPLSFMSSIFGMNAVEFTGSSNSVMGIREQFEFMFPISIALTLFFLYLALKAPSPKLIKLPLFLFFPIVLLRALWYGFRDKRKKWEGLFLYLHVGSAKEKLGEDYREMVTDAYQWWSASKVKNRTKPSSENSDNKEQAATNDESYEEFFLGGDKVKDSAPTIGDNYV